MRDTIAAIATATGGGVGMVRLSGPQALAVAGRVFRPMNPAKSPETMPGYTGAFGRVCHGEQLLDEAVLFVYHAPHSYTGEDVAEFCCHGGEFVLSQVLAAVIAAGARPAEAGEYTRRALMNGRMTLTEAESVIDILAAQNTQSLRKAPSTGRYWPPPILSPIAAPTSPPGSITPRRMWRRFLPPFCWRG